MPDPTTPNPTGTAPAVRRATQNKLIANYVVAAQTFLRTASTDAEIRPILEQHGYDGAEFAAGAGLDLRQEKLGGRENAQDELNLSADAARDTYAAFRAIARAAFPSQDDRVGLALTGDVPEDFQRFVTLAPTSYTNAGKAPYTAKITTRGYPRRASPRCSETSQASLKAKRARKKRPAKRSKRQTFATKPTPTSAPS